MTYTCQTSANCRFALAANDAESEGTVMPTQTHLHDTAGPTGFIVLPALIGGLVWLCVILSHLPH